MSEPELVYVICWEHFSAFCVEGRTNMGVAIDKAWRGEFAMAVNFTGAFGGAPGGIYRKPRYAYCRDLSDDAIFDNDIGRPQGGAPVPSITVMPRRTSRTNGPVPRSLLVAGVTWPRPFLAKPATISSPTSMGVSALDFTLSPIILVSTQQRLCAGAIGAEGSASTVSSHSGRDCGIGQSLGRWAVIKLA